MEAVPTTLIPSDPDLHKLVGKTLLIVTCLRTAFSKRNAVKPYSMDVRDVPPNLTAGRKGGRSEGGREWEISTVE